MKHSSANPTRKIILTWSERITPGVPTKAVNMALMEENKELRSRIADLEAKVEQQRFIISDQRKRWGNNTLLSPI